MVLFASFKMMAEQAPVANIGDISELNGSAQILRNEPINASLQLEIQSNDEAITTDGRMAITFLDDSIVRLTEHSQLLIDEYIFDPDPSKSKMALTFALGTITPRVGLLMLWEDRARHRLGRVVYPVRRRGSGTLVRSPIC